MCTYICMYMYAYIHTYIHAPTVGGGKYVSVRTEEEMLTGDTETAMGTAGVQKNFRFANALLTLELRNICTCVCIHTYVNVCTYIHTYIRM